jgi:transposase-like protein
LELLQVSGNVSALARQLGVHRTTLHYWVRQVHKKGLVADPQAPETPADPQARRIQELERQIAVLEGVVGRQAVESGFFRGALRRVEESRPKTAGDGGTASTPKSER